MNVDDVRKIFIIEMTREKSEDARKSIFDTTLWIYL